MSAQNYSDLIAHDGHSISIYKYYDENVAIECEDCFEVLLDFDKEK
jgi:aspartate/tyrosine/aromatic aminotransferase